MLGSIAQLVQSVCLTSRGSGVRLPLLPRERLEKSSLFLLYTVEPPALCLAASAAHRRTEFPKETQGGDARNRSENCFGMPLGAVAQRLGDRRKGPGVPGPGVRLPLLPQEKRSELSGRFFCHGEVGDPRHLTGISAWSLVKFI